MPTDVLVTLQAWAIAALAYPGLIYGVALALAGEWAYALARPLLTDRILRRRRGRQALFQPLFDFVKLSGRRSSANAGLLPPSLITATASGIVSLAGAVAPVLALALMPLPGSPTGGKPALGAGDLLTVLALLAVHPISNAVLRLASGGMAQLRGARDLGRLATGLFPTLVAVAALIEVAGAKNLALSGLTAAPETPAQTLVRLVCGAALLAALPWWLDMERDGAYPPASQGPAAYAGHLLQRAALAVFWALLVVPFPGELTWAVAVQAASALFAYITMRRVAESWAPGMKEGEAAALVWKTALPAAAVALLASLIWPGA